MRSMAGCLAENLQIIRFGMMKYCLDPDLCCSGHGVIVLCVLHDSGTKPTESLGAYMKCSEDTGMTPGCFRQISTSLRGDGVEGFRISQFIQMLVPVFNTFSHCPEFIPIVKTLYNICRQINK